MQCPCGSGKTYDLCCGPCLRGESRPPTAEALMRSRYTAYARGDIDYIARTLAPESRGDFDAAAARTWAAQAQWLGLRILSTEKGQAGDEQGVVTFVATYRQDGETIEHREVSRFCRTVDGEWRFLAGDTQARRVGAGGRPDRGESPPPILRAAPKAGRNDPCPCGSGRKYKKCCGA